MRRPWSISTTVRNPERLRDFLMVLKQLEGGEFNANNQKRYQILLIRSRLYRPNRLTPQQRELLSPSNTEPIPYETAEEIFDSQRYEDPAMRGRQSANPLNKLGFAIARQGFGRIQITDLGNSFLAGDYDISSVFFKSLLKLQFPNPWSPHFSTRQDFDIIPFVATLHLLHKLNGSCDESGLNKNEFSIFVPTLINSNQIGEQVKRVLQFRKSQDKENYIKEFAVQFYCSDNIRDTHINNLFDYGDNIIRYFRLTRYFKISSDPTGRHWHVDIEKSRIAEIQQILNKYDGSAQTFDNLQNYLTYLADIKQPELPWENLQKLQQIALSWHNIIDSEVSREQIQLSDEEKRILQEEFMILSKTELEKHISKLRSLNVDIKIRLKKSRITKNVDKLKSIISCLRDRHIVRQYTPEQFEKTIAEALQIINDEILIKPNYPVDDNGEPISHAPANKPDIECYYKSFNATCEVTLERGRLQWVLEGQPVMRHLRDFEEQYHDKEVFCLFIAPYIHNDTFSTFWYAVRYEYNGRPQKIIPMNVEMFAILLQIISDLIERNRSFSHDDLRDLYANTVSQSKELPGFSEWAKSIPVSLQSWKQGILE